MSKLKVGDTVTILRVADSNAPTELIGQSGKVVSVYDGTAARLTKPYCILDIAPGGIYTHDLVKDEDWDE